MGSAVSDSTPSNRTDKREEVVSRPRGDGDYSYRKEFYRDASVADDYDRHRFTSKKRQRRNARKWRTILKALALTEGVRSVLDLPCGTGRFTGHLADAGYDVIGSDISHEMMQVADKNLAQDGIKGYVQSDAERLPLATDSVDCVMSIRFFMHVDPPTRVRILREMGRISRRYLVVDYRHRYTLRNAVLRAKHRLGLAGELERVSRADLEREIAEAGLTLRRIIPVAPLFSDKWIVLVETTSGS